MLRDPGKRIGDTWYYVEENISDLPRYTTPASVLGYCTCNQPGLDPLDETWRCTPEGSSRRVGLQLPFNRKRDPF